MSALMLRRRAMGRTGALALDDFSEATGTAIIGKASDIPGTAWVARGGGTAFTVQSGKAAPSGDIGGAGAERWGLLDIATDTNVEVSALITVGDVDRVDVGLVARVPMGAATIDCYLLAITDLASNDRQWRLLRYVGGSAMALAESAAGAIANGQTYDVRLRCVGATISAVIDGVVVGSATDTSHPATNRGAGIRYYPQPGAAGENGSSRLADFKVTTP